MPFQKGIDKVPGSGKKKGSKDQKTLAWERIGEYVTGEGADRYLSILAKLPDKDYKIEFRAIVEYFRPKLTRAQIQTEVSSELTDAILKAFDVIDEESDIFEPDNIRN